MALADALDALTHARPYKAAQPFDEAVDRLSAEAGTAFDPATVEALSKKRNEVREIMEASA